MNDRTARHLVDALHALEQDWQQRRRLPLAIGGLDLYRREIANPLTLLTGEELADVSSDEAHDCRWDEIEGVVEAFGFRLGAGYVVEPAE